MPIKTTDTKASLAIEAQGLTKRFGPRCAVDNLNLTVRSGAIFGFLGPNGAGKTTTIRMLLGLISPTSGSGRILGFDIVSERPAFLSQIGAIVESSAFYPALSGYDNLYALALISGHPNVNNLTEVLTQVGLNERARDKVRTYSLGMKQRLAIAAALLNHPKIIFLDEPTNGLDPAGTVSIRELIRSLGASGHTIFLSSHLLHEVEQVCDEVAIVNHGKVISQGRVADLLKQEAALLIEAEPLASVQAIALRFGTPCQVSGPRSATITLTQEQTPEFVSSLVSAGVKVYKVAPVQSSLEHIFLELTDGTHTQSPQVMTSAVTANR